MGFTQYPAPSGGSGGSADFDTADELATQIDNETTGSGPFVRQVNAELAGTTLLETISYNRADAQVLDLGTIADAGTATLDDNYSKFSLVASGQSWTLSVPVDFPEGDVVIFGESTSALDAQTVTLSNSAIRPEQSATELVNSFVIPVGSSAKFIIYLRIDSSSQIDTFSVVGDSFTPATPASTVTFSSGGGLSATTVQGAISELDTEKANTADLADVALSGDYADLLNVPSVPTIPAIASFAVGSAYSVTNSSAAVTFGTTNPVIRLTTAGTYLLFVPITVQFNGATFGSNATVTLKIRRTNNTAADVSNSTTTFGTGVVTTASGVLTRAQLPLVGYTTSNTDDLLTVYADVSAGPSAGSLQITSCSVLALKVGSYTVQDTTPPTLSSADIDVTGDTLTLNFNEIVGIGAGGSTGVTITPDGGAATVTYLSGAGTTSLVFDISRTILSGETVTLDYTNPGDGFEDLSGNDLATISGSSVTNNSTSTGFTPTVGTFASDYMTTSTAGVAWSDTKTFTASFWIKFNGGDGVLQQIFRNGNGRFLIEKTTANLIRATASTTGGTATLNISGSTALTVASGWTHVLICVDTADAANHIKRKIFINGVADTITETTFNNNVMDLLDAFMRFGGGASGANKITADVCEVWLDDTYVDDPTLFAAGGVPISLGANGQLPKSGTPPAFYWSLGVWTGATVSDASGNGNDATVTGSIAAGTPP